MPDLAQELEDTARLGLSWQRQVLELPVDTDNGDLLRAQAAAASSALNTQIRADSLRLRAERQDKALERLIEAIRSQEGRVPKTESRSASLTLLADAPV